MKITTKKILAALGCVALVTTAGVTVARYHTIADIPTPDKTPHLEIFMSGKNFKPDQEYIITLLNGEKISTRSTKDGDLNLSRILPYEVGQEKILQFNLDENNPNDLISPSLQINFDTEKEKLTWKGRFFSPSEPVNFTISNNTKLKESGITTDWSGNFVHDISYKDINIIKESVCLDAQKSKEQLCLSFGIHRSPKITEILTIGPSTPGGPSDDPFSPFDSWTEPSDCTPLAAPFDRELSLCNASHVASLQQELFNTYYDFTRMTLQLSAGMMQQVGFIGMLYDAKHQLETQLMFWEKQERAHEDYHPSEQLCSIASMARGLAAQEARKDLNTYGFARALSYEDQNPVNSNSQNGAKDNIQMRVQQFRQVYCAPTNFDTSLRLFCEGLSAGNVARMNRDVDFTSLVDIPKTLDVNITDGVDSSADEQDLMAMGRLLFGHKTMDWPQPGTDIESRNVINSEEYINKYQEHRSLSAIRNVARYSFANLIGMKSSGTGLSNTEVKGLLSEFGMTPADIDLFIGENPSYFAQMHVLTKQVFQHPNFYTNLITKETNIDRFGVTMEALQLMSKRDKFEAAMRKEMLLSLMIEMKLRDLQQFGVDVDLKDLSSRVGPRR